MKDDKIDKMIYNYYSNIHYYNQSDSMCLWQMV